MSELDGSYRSEGMERASAYALLMSCTRSERPTREAGLYEALHFAVGLRTMGFGIVVAWPGSESGMRNEFTSVIEQDGEWFVGYCPEIPGANGQGKTAEECRASLSAAIA